MQNNTYTESKNLFSFIKKKVEELKKLVGVVDQKAPISFELSEFMQEFNSSFEELPNQYKKLYNLKSAPEDFFLNREKEISKLENSFENWIKNRFVTSAIIGEKGCGITSTLDAFLRKIPETKSIKIELNEKIYNSDKYFKFFNSILKKYPIYSK